MRLRRLSVFAGGWTLEAAESVCAGGGVDPTGILDLLTSLVDKSLVLAETQHGEARYRLLETVRQYACDRLVEAGEEAEVRTRHRAWCVALAEQADTEIHGPRQREWQTRLVVEHDNLRAALLWSREDPKGAEALLRLAAALTWFWWFHGNWSEAHGWFEEALNRRKDAPRPLLPDVYYGATYYAWRRGDYERAKKIGQEGLAIARDLGDKRNSAFLVTNLGIVAMREMEYAEAAERYEEGVRLARESGYKWYVSVCLSQQGILARVQGSLALAADLHEEALTLMRELGDTAMISYTLRCLGNVSLQKGDSHRAARIFAESLRLSREAGFQWISVECLVGLAGVSSDHAQHDRAARLFGAVESLQAAFGFRHPSYDQVEYDRRVASTRSRLGEEVFDGAWAEGRAMTLEQAIEYALKAGTRPEEAPSSSSNVAPE